MKVIITITLLMAILTGCGDSNVSLVKDGTLASYPNSTVGNAFEGTFEDCDWDAETNAKGATIVTFTGKITPATHANVLLKTNLPIRYTSMGLSENLKKDEYFKRLNIQKAKLFGEYSQDKWTKLQKRLVALPRDRSHEINTKKQQVANSKGKFLQEYKDELAELEQHQKKHIDSLPEKKEIEQWLVEYRRQKQLKHDQFIKIDHTIKKELFEEWKEETVWPIGETVTFKWVISADGTSFEISGIESDSFSKMGYSLNEILRVIYSS